MPGKRHRLGNEFPREGFVQAAIERHFQERGYRIENGGHVDLDCVHPETGERWIVEAKGETSAVGLDFRTGLGQLLLAMDKPDVTYGIAVPETPKFETQLTKVPRRVRQRLGITILRINRTGEVRFDVPPNPELAG